MSERRYVETEEYLAFVGRVLTALGRRVARADIEMLRGIADLSGVIERELAVTVAALRAEHGYSWADIGRALGITRQAAQQRFGCQDRVDT